MIVIFTDKRASIIPILSSWEWAQTRETVSTSSAIAHGFNWDGILTCTPTYMDGSTHESILHIFCCTASSAANSPKHVFGWKGTLDLLLRFVINSKWFDRMEKIVRERMEPTLRFVESFIGEGHRRKHEVGVSIEPTFPVQIKLYRLRKTEERDRWQDRGKRHIRSWFRTMI